MPSKHMFEPSYDTSFVDRQTGYSIAYNKLLSHMKKAVCKRDLENFGEIVYNLEAYIAKSSKDFNIEKSAEDWDKFVEDAMSNIEKIFETPLKQDYDTLHPKADAPKNTTYFAAVRFAVYQALRKERRISIKLRC